jgi:6-phosphogluconolactonase
MAAAAPMTASLSWAAEPTAYWVYFGTYTGGKSGSKGIYRSKLDPKAGTLTAAELAAEFPSPSFLAVAPDGKALYAVGEKGSDDSGKGGAVTGYELDPATGKLTGMATLDTQGVGPCHLSLSPDGRMLLVASYGDGTATFYDASGNWLALKGKLEDGSTMEYRRV